MTALLSLLVASLLQGGVEPAQDAVQPTQQAPPVQVVEETEIDRQVRQLSAELRCPVCQALSLQDSPSELSQEMRDVIRSRLEAGETPDQIKEYFVGRYGEWILLKPEARGFNLTVYLLPVILVLLGGAILVVAGRRWLSSAPAEARAADEDVGETDPDLAPWEDVASR